MSVSKEEGLKRIQEIVNSWTKKYAKKTVHLFDKVGGPSTFDLILTLSSFFRFLTEFSIPTRQKPIPEAAVRVTFYLKKEESGDLDVEYIFDNSSLVHSLKRTIRPEMMERWIDRHL